MKNIKPCKMKCVFFVMNHTLNMLTQKAMFLSKVTGTINFSRNVL